MNRSMFPYPPRTCQERMMDIVRRTVESGGHALIDAPTGTGKTIAALVPILEHLSGEGQRKKLLYLTRTNSQQRQVILEMRSVKRVSGCDMLATGFQGRRNLCPTVRQNRRMRAATSEEVSRFCSELKRRKGGRKCPYYRGFVSGDVQQYREWYEDTLPTVEEAYTKLVAGKVCPYEFIRVQARRARVVAAPYLYLFHAPIRARMLDALNVQMENLIVTVDEAHNLPEFARQTASCTFSLGSARRARREAVAFGDPSVLEGMRASMFFEELQNALREISSEFLRKEDEALIPPDDLRIKLMTGLGVTSISLEKIVAALIAYGDSIRSMKLGRDALPRSYVGAAGEFLASWESLDDEMYVRLVHSKRDPHLTGYCLDASMVASVLRGVHASIHMSGTLTPLEQYRDVVGLPRERTVMCTLPSPFPPENRKIVYSMDVTTRFDDIMADEKVLENLWRMLRRLCDSVKRNTVVFFPSFRMLSEFLGSKWAVGLSPEPYIERQRMPQQEVMEMLRTFKRRTGSPLLFGVVGGRLSEGLDFPDRELEVVVLVGIPYPKPSPAQRALQRYYELKFGAETGWTYAVRAPTVRRMLQCVGRLIRNETDRGVAVILDRRAAQFASALGGASGTSDPMTEVERFFQGSVR